MEPGNDEMLVHIYLNWKDSDGKTVCKGIRWRMMGCVFCEEALSKWKEHAVHAHRGEGYSQLKIDGCSQWEDSEGSPHHQSSDVSALDVKVPHHQSSNVSALDGGVQQPMKVDNCTQWVDNDVIRQDEKGSGQATKSEYWKDSGLHKQGSGQVINSESQSSISSLNEDQDTVRKPSVVVRISAIDDSTPDVQNIESVGDASMSISLGKSVETREDALVNQSELDLQKPVLGHEIEKIVLSLNSNSEINHDVNSNQDRQNGDKDCIDNSNSEVQLSQNGDKDCIDNSNSEVQLSPNETQLSPSVTKDMNGKVEELPQSSAIHSKTVIIYECRNSKCSLTFNRKNKLLLHERICSHGVKNVQCQNCQQFKTKMHQCSLCGKQYRNKSSLTRHKKLYHRKAVSKKGKTKLQKTAKYSTDQSQEGDENEEVEIQFPKSDHDVVVLQDKNSTQTKKKAQCDVCSRWIMSVAHLKRHKLIHTDPQRCSVCWRMYKNMHALVNHIISAHPESGMTMAKFLKDTKNRTSTTCEICSKTCPSQAHLRRHMMLMHTDQQTCSFCQKVYKNMNGLAKHMVSAHPECGMTVPDFINQTTKKDTPIQCDICSRTCPSQAHLRRHMLIHTDPQRCSICQKGYKNMMGLKRHMALVHPDEEGNQRNAENQNADIKTDIVSENAEDTDGNDIVSENAEDTDGNDTKSNLIASIMALNADQEEVENIRKSRRAKKGTQLYFEDENSLEEDYFEEDHSSDDDWVADSGETDHKNGDDELGVRSVHDIKKEIEDCSEPVEAGYSEPVEAGMISNMKPNLDSTIKMEVGDFSEDHVNQDGDHERLVTKTQAQVSLDIVSKSEDHEELQEGKDFCIIRMGEKSIFKCNICSKKFKWKSHFERHYEFHRRKSIQKKTVKTRIRFGKAKQKESYECQICHKVFKWGSHLARHYECHDENEMVKCNLCDRMFKSHRKMVGHMQRKHNMEGKSVNTGGRLYKCPSKLCDKTFNYKSDKRQHEVQEHGGKPYDCEVCWKKFISMCHLQRHMEKHTEEQVCDICQKKCKNASTLRRHRKKHTGEGFSSMCQYCGKIFTNAGRLKTHEMLHTDKEMFKCSFCEKCLSNSADLRLHMQRHTGYLYLCKHCGKGMPTKLKLTEHEAIHTGVKAFKCPVCEQMFRTTGQLFCHKLRHEEKRFSCNICNKKFFYKCDMDAHYDVHSDQRKHKCDQCDRRFNHISNKIAHIKQVHLGIKRTGHGKGRRSTDSSSKMSRAKTGNEEVEAPLNYSNTVITASSSVMQDKDDISSKIMASMQRSSLQGIIINQGNDNSSNDMPGPSHRSDTIQDSRKLPLHLPLIDQSAALVHPRPPYMPYHGLHADAMLYPVSTDRGRHLVPDREQMLGTEQGQATERGLGQYKMTRPDIDYYNIVDTVINFKDQ